MLWIDSSASENLVSICSFAAEIIGAGLGRPVWSLTPDEAHAHFDWLARFVAIDNPIFSALTRESLDGAPRNPASHGHEGKRVLFVMHSRLPACDFWCCFFASLTVANSASLKKLKN
jgi:hypothetical protein